MNPFVYFCSRKRILKRGRLTSCMILIALVMAPLVCALIFSDSMMQGITNKYIYLSDGHVQLTSRQNGKSLSEFDTSSYEDMVYSADIVTSGYALMYSATGTSNVMIKGVDESYFNDLRLKQISYNYVSGATENSNVRGIAISKATAKALNVEIGDRLALMIVPDNVDKVLRPVLVRIDAIFTSGYDQLDQMICFVSRDYAQQLYSDELSSTIEILALPEYQEKLNALEFALSEDYYVSQWSEHNVSVYENFVTSKQMIFIILLLVVVVAAFYTASVAQQMIQDDIRSIAISKLIGASDSMIRGSAMISVYTVTFLGMVLGIALGLAIGCNLGPILTWLSSMGLESLSFYLLDFDITIPWLSILAISMCLLVVSFISILLTLCKTRRITPMRLFTSL